jgi:hypothetical protein
LVSKFVALGLAIINDTINKPIHKMKIRRTNSFLFMRYLQWWFHEFQAQAVPAHKLRSIAAFFDEGKPTDDFFRFVNGAGSMKPRIPSDPDYLGSFNELLKIR